MATQSTPPRRNRKREIVIFVLVVLAVLLFRAMGVKTTAETRREREEKMRTMPGARDKNDFPMNR